MTRPYIPAVPQSRFPLSPVPPNNCPLFHGRPLCGDSYTVRFSLYISYLPTPRNTNDTWRYMLDTPASSHPVSLSSVVPALLHSSNYVRQITQVMWLLSYPASSTTKIAPSWNTRYAVSAIWTLSSFILSRTSYIS